MKKAAKNSQKWCSFDRYIPGDKPRRIRCDCSKMVTTRAVYCIGGELVGFRIPPHKTKPKMTKRPKGDKSARRV